jgi:uncharacterized NAD(P)/FAD-binding protein YdhS
MGGDCGSGDCSQFTVAVIGGGFSGSVVAAQLLRQSRAASVVLIEKSARPGKGVAYGTRCSEHLLNVRARNMSAFPDDPEHFLRWLRVHHDANATPLDFIPRQVYGEYVTSVLELAVQPDPKRFEFVQDEAVAIRQSEEGAEIQTSNGQTLYADKVVLALGNFPPSDPPLPGRTAHSMHYVSNPWTPSAVSEVTKEQGILLIGSGLTSVDVGISLRAQGFKGTIHVLSRRGLLPQTHRHTTPWPAFWNQQSQKTMTGLMRLIRREAEAAELAGSDWRAVVDSLRPFTQQIWTSLSTQGKRQFLRHARAYWDVHRHRVAPAIGARLAEELASGSTQIHSGRITQYREDGDGAEVTYRDRKSAQLVRLRVGRVINCTGPESDLRKLHNALLQDLIGQKMIRPDSLNLGLAVTGDGALVDANGVPSDFLYTLGPTRKGKLWETTAVPEIRAQAAELAICLLQEKREEKKTVSTSRSQQLPAVGAIGT